MKALQRADGYVDPHVNRLAKDVQIALARVPDTQYFTITDVWLEPYTLRVPAALANEPVRTVEPYEIRCVRAVDLTDPAIQIAPGGLCFDWAGQGIAKIPAAHGLTPGHKYKMTFVVVG